VYAPRRGPSKVESEGCCRPERAACGRPCGGRPSGSSVGGSGFPGRVLRASRSSLCLTPGTLGVFSPARLASAAPRVADCRGCSVECRCCAPPAGRIGSESHSTRRSNCRKAALGRTYGNLPGSVSGVPARRPVGVRPPVLRSSLGWAVSLVGKSILWISPRRGRDTPDRVGRRRGREPPGSGAFY
jgi:hypothetical protein